MRPHEIDLRASVHHLPVGKPKLDWAALIDRRKGSDQGHPANID